MRADCVHGVIGRKMKKKTAEIYTFDYFVELCRAAGKSITPLVMNYCDFYQFSAQQRLRKSKTVVMPLLSELCEVSFKKGSRSLFCKRAFNEAATEVDFLRPAFDINVMPAVQPNPRGIPLAKKRSHNKTYGSCPTFEA